MQPSTTRLSRQEFAARLRRHTKRSALATFVSLILGLGWLAFFPMVAEKFGGSVGPNGTLLVKSCWYAGILAGFCVGPWISWRQARPAGLQCPECKKRLVENVGMVTVASGKCGYCGADVCG
jgi:hypothetical protein